MGGTLVVVFFLLRGPKLNDKHLSSISSNAITFSNCLPKKFR